MASAPKNLADLLGINNENLSGGVVNELLQAVPLLAAISSLFSSNGEKHQFLRYNDPPAAGFRSENAGLARSSSRDANVTLDCKITSSNSIVDRAIADAYRFGRASYVARENMRHLQSLLQLVERQVLNGTAGTDLSQASGFLGLTNARSSINPDNVIDAGGTTNLTSMYLLRSTDPLTTEALVLGNDGNVSVGSTTEQMIDDAVSGEFYPALVTPIESWYAYQQAGTYTAVRVANIDTQSGTPVVTDDLIGQAYAKFKANEPPTHIVYNRICWEQHRASRTATNSTGAEAPFPQDAYNLPIIVTDQFSVAETQVT